MIPKALLYQLAQVERYWRDTGRGRDGCELTVMGTPHLILVLKPGELPAQYTLPPGDVPPPADWRGMLADVRAGQRAQTAGLAPGEAIGVVRQTEDGDRWFATGVLLLIDQRLVVIDPLYECMISAVGLAIHSNAAGSQKRPWISEALVLVTADGRRRGLVMPALHAQLEAGGGLVPVVNAACGWQR